MSWIRAVAVVAALAGSGPAVAAERPRTGAIPSPTYDELAVRKR
jgi:hypothetical protein